MLAYDCFAEMCEYNMLCGGSMVHTVLMCLCYWDCGNIVCAKFCLVVVVLWRLFALFLNYLCGDSMYIYIDHI